MSQCILGTPLWIVFEYKEGTPEEGAEDALVSSGYTCTFCQGSGSKVVYRVCYNISSEIN